MANFQNKSDPKKTAQAMTKAKIRYQGSERWSKISAGRVAKRLTGRMKSKTVRTWPVNAETGYFAAIKTRSIKRPTPCGLTVQKATPARNIIKPKENITPRKRNSKKSVKSKAVNTNPPWVKTYHQRKITGGKLVTSNQSIIRKETKNKGLIGLMRVRSNSPRSKRSGNQYAKFL